MRLDFSNIRADFFQNFRFILENISYGIMFESTNHEILFVNQNFCDYLNIPITPELLIGANSSIVTDHLKCLVNNFPKYLNNIQKIYKDNKEIFNDEVIMSNGETIYRDYKPIMSPSLFPGHLWIYKDAQRIKNIQVKALGEKAFYEDLLNKLPADIALFDENHTYLYVNKIALSDEGKRNWIIGKNDFDYCNIKNRPIFLAINRREKFLEAIQSGEMVEFEETLVANDGSEVHHLRRFYPYLEKDGISNRVIGYGINITKIKERENILKEQEFVFKKMVDSLDHIVVSIDCNGYITYANDKWDQLTGMSEFNYQSMKLSDFFYKGKTLFLNALKSFLSESASNTALSQVCLKDKNRKSRTLTFHLSRFSTSPTQAMRIAVFFNDITDQLAAEKKLKKIALEERKLNNIKSSFISLVSHELRTPLSIILSNTELIDLVSLKKGEHLFDKYTNRIIQQINKMTRLMNEFLFLSKAESGSIPYTPSQIDITLFITKLVEDQFSPWQDGRFLELSFRGQKKIVHADYLMLSHIFSNLITNAFKYSEGKFSPKLRIYFFEKHCDFVLMDFGIGIPAIERKFIYNAFYRGGNVGSIEGTGFGLMVVNLFVKMNKGKIYLKSIEGKGTSFVIRFPF